MENQSQQQNIGVEESNLVQGLKKKPVDLEVEEVNGMTIPNALTLSLDTIDFNGMSAENIIYVIENNKNGRTIDNNLSKDYVLELAKQDIKLAKCLLINLNFNEEFGSLLNYVLENESTFEVPLSLEISEDLRMLIIEIYLKAGNYEFVSKNIKMVISDLLLKPYKFDETKTILEVILDNNIILTDECYEFLLKKPTALLTFIKYKSYLNQISSNDKYNMIFYETLKVKENMEMLYNFLKENFSEYKDDPNIQNLAKNSDDIAMLFIDNRIFMPFIHQPFRKIFNNYTVLDYVLTKSTNGEYIDTALEFFDNELIRMYNESYRLKYPEQKKLLEYIKIYCNYKRFEPFIKITNNCFINLLDGNQFDCLEYILKINPNFEGSKEISSMFCLQHYMKVGNWDFVSDVINGPVRFRVDELFEVCYYDSSKMVIEVLIENNIKLGDEVIAILTSLIFEDAPERIKKERMEKLLSKDEKGVSLFERLLKSQEKLVSQFVSLSHNFKIYGNGVPLELFKILIKCGVSINANEVDSHFNEFYDQLQNFIFNIDYKEHQYPIIFTQKQLDLVTEFVKLYTNDSDPTMIKVVLNNFYKWVISQPEQAMGYLENLIIIKKHFPNFVLEHKKYSQKIGGVFLEDRICSIYDYSVFNHELGHAIHKFAALCECPPHIQTLIEQFKVDPRVRARIQDYALKKQDIIDEYEISWRTDFYEYLKKIYPDGMKGYEREVRESYQRNIDNPDMQFAEVVMRGGLNYLTQENINGDAPIDWDVYYRVTLENDQTEFWKRIRTFKFRNVFQIEGIIDALFEGKWLDGNLEGVTARCYMGHGSAYFRLDPSSSFKEVFAFFSSLMTTSSLDSEEIVRDLRFLLGDELYDALYEYYRELNKTK